MKKRVISLLLMTALAVTMLGGCVRGNVPSVSGTNEPSGDVDTAPTVSRDYKNPDDVDTILRIHPDEKLDVIGNKLSNLNYWSYPSSAFRENVIGNTYPFVEEIQFMTATGGNAERDLFKDPADRSVLDDYDFSPLVNGCRIVLDQGVKPMIKTGNIPWKYSTNAYENGYAVNVLPPDDYDVYFNYIQALVQTLVDTFGLEEVRTWRWGCFTEYDNGSWFMGDWEDYCKIYDCTVAAIQSVLGFDIQIGAHSMTVSSRWDLQYFIKHCITGTNYYTGEQGTRLTYLSTSYYDETIEFAGTSDLTSRINTLRDPVNKYVEEALAAGITKEHLDELGITSIYYGVDEGRILSGKRGASASDLIDRIVGHTKQAAFDAMLLDQMVENDIDYLSSWGFRTGGFGGLPTVSYHVASEFYKMVDTVQVETTVERHVETSYSKYYDHKQNAIASVDENGTVYAMVYDYRNVPKGVDEDMDVGNSIHLLMDMDCEKAKITFAWVNDDSNFFDEWVRDYEAAGLTKDDFNWSRDSTSLPGNLISDLAKQTFNSNVSEGSNYEQCSTLKTSSEEVVVTDGELYYHMPLEPNSVVFLKIEPIE